jgi:hypothetical protein
VLRILLAVYKALDMSLTVFKIKPVLLCRIYDDKLIIGLGFLGINPRHGFYVVKNIIK